MAGLQIFCLEDDAELRDVMVETFSFLEPGSHIELCATLEQSRRLFANDVNRFHLYLIDIRVPGGSGLDFVRLLRNSGCTSIIALMSAYTRPKRAVLESLDCHWLPKPLYAESLLEMLHLAQSATSAY
jgi:DNA-binding response OmpR family regulator